MQYDLPEIGAKRVYVATVVGSSVPLLSKNEKDAEEEFDVLVQMVAKRRDSASVYYDYDRGTWVGCMTRGMVALQKETNE